MLSPSDFNNAVPQFTNGNYASNPLNPQYIAEPSSTDYNRGVEPIQTLPAQWWNWFMNKFTTRFNKVNVYVKNIFNELSQLLSLVSETPSGTEGEPTIGQLKDMFETKYPDYLKTTPALSNTYVPQTTTVNGHALSGNVTVCCVACAGANGSGTAFGTASTLNTGTAAGCIPIVGTALGTTNGQFVATDANGCLKPSGYTASCFRASTWTPTCVACAGCDGSGCAFGTAARCAASAFRSCTWTPACVSQAGVLLSYFSGTAYVVQMTAAGSSYICMSGCCLGVGTSSARPVRVAYADCASKDGSGCAFGTAARYNDGRYALAYNGNQNCVLTALTASAATIATTAVKLCYYSDMFALCKSSSGTTCVFLCNRCSHPGILTLPPGVLQCCGVQLTDQIGRYYTANMCVCMGCVNCSQFCICFGGYRVG